MSEEVLYKGDSWAKKSVRLRTWEGVQRVLGHARFASGPHLFLSSSEGGDASVLRALGAPDEAMLAVDWDRKAAASFAASYPGVKIEVAEVSGVLASGRRLTSAFLDFSCQVSFPLLKSVRLAAASVRPGGIVACTFCIGRERGTRWTSVQERFLSVEAEIVAVLGRRPDVMHAFSYSSSSVHGPGSLMGVLVARAAPASGPFPPVERLSIQDFYRDVMRHSDSPVLHLLFNCSVARAKSLRSRVAEYPPPPAA